VGRGAFPGYCTVFAGPAPNEASRERLQAFVRTRDGFELAELDFRLRGPGALLGTRQHGLPPLVFADLNRDSELLAEARAAAQTLLSADPELTDPAWQRVKALVLRRYGEHLELGDVG
jgi:ATP-dependent DNA helicase RecG